MKVKLINKDGLSDHSITVGKIYEVIESYNNKDFYSIFNDEGRDARYKKNRFVDACLEEELEKAKQKVLEIEKQIEVNKPKFKVGQKYRTNNGDTVWMIVYFNCKYGFVCIEGSYDLGLSYSGKLHDKIEDIFIGNLKYFTLIK